MPATPSKRKTSTSADRRRTIATALVGAAITLLVVFADLAGWLAPLERMAYDQRARHFQFFTPPPSDRIVHLDIDDSSLEAIGKWEWPRDMLADLLLELGRAEPKAVCLDITFPDYTISNTPGTLAPQDRKLADAIAKLGNVLVPVNFSREATSQTQPWHTAVRDALTENSSLERAQLEQQVRASRVLLPDSDEELRNAFIKLRREVVYEKTRKMLAERAYSLEEVKDALIPSSIRGDESTLSRVVEKAYDKARAAIAIERFSFTAQPDAPPLMAPTSQLAPIAELSTAAAMSGTVDYDADPDGILRSVPLFVEYNGRVYPQMALAIACFTLGVDPRDLRIEPGRIVIRASPTRAQIVIPTHIGTTPTYGRYGALMDLPWFGGPDTQWLGMYDYPDRKANQQHVPMAKLYDAINVNRRIETALSSIDDAVLTIYEAFDPDIAAQYKIKIKQSDSLNTRQEFVRLIRDDPDIADTIREIQSRKESGSELNDDEKQLLLEYTEVQQAESILKNLSVENEQLAAELRNDFHDKIVFVGFTASSSVEADFKTTSLHAQCPGVMSHSTIVNAILTGDLWRRAPSWLTPLLVCALGLSAGFSVAFFTPLVASGVIAFLFLGYAAFNTLVLFDYANLISPLITPPLLATGAAWAGCAFYRYIDERRARASVTARFRSYVDPALVDYYLAHPEQTTLAGETRELTLVFTDLAGFTTISEQLKGETVPLLNEYMARMVPVIREHGGYLNKFLGDGIMFFFGAPIPNERHALDAVATVLHMQRELDGFNELLRARSLPPVKMRVGVLTGEAVVGDAGSISAARPEDRASDYTALGDNVNTASRLEGANKATGTLVLLSQSTVDQLKGLYLVRPIAKLQVVGKTQGVMAYEPLARFTEATEEQRQLAASTKTMVDHYTAARWTECVAACDALDARFGHSKLTDLYRRACRELLQNPPADFQGTIVLTEK